mmetsp:Transcript_6219/g.17885  ORF Transcript_6219/g.17885 Transcript_6219/m.17885 type:complete len:292 (-) Transcript_6219:220-1095(-)
MTMTSWRQQIAPVPCNIPGHVIIHMHASSVRQPGTQERGEGKGRYITKDHDGSQHKCDGTHAEETPSKKGLTSRRRTTLGGRRCVLGGTGIVLAEREWVLRVGGSVLADRGGVLGAGGIVLSGIVLGTANVFLRCVVFGVVYSVVILIFGLDVLAVRVLHCLLVEQLLPVAAFEVGHDECKRSQDHQALGGAQLRRSGPADHRKHVVALNTQGLRDLLDFVFDVRMIDDRQGVIPDGLALLGALDDLVALVEDDHELHLVFVDHSDELLILVEGCVARVRSIEDQEHGLGR